MTTVHDQLSEQFYAWEERGRGWRVFPQLIRPEPLFRPLQFDLSPSASEKDDGRKPGLITSFFQAIRPRPPVCKPADEEPPEPDILEREPSVELEIVLPEDSDTSKEAFAQFLSNLTHCQQPIAFEILGGPERVTAQFAVSPPDLSQMQLQLHAHFPEAVFRPCKDRLATAWTAIEGDEALVIEFGLGREFMFPLSVGKLDPFVGIVGALSHLQKDELGLLQVLFEPVSSEWAEGIVEAVTHSDGKPLFINAPELASAAENKVGKRLYAAVVRVAAKSVRFERAFEIARDVACSLAVFSEPGGNELIPLTNSEYHFELHVEDTLLRQTRRSGMILNSEELMGLVHLPSVAIRSPVFLRQTGKTKAAPQIARGNEGLFIGNNVHLEETVPVRLTREQRVRHTHLLGASGTGKSTLLFNLIQQDIQNGDGLAVLDPHGDLIDKVLCVIPASRIDDVVLVNPSDEEYAIGFNILSAHSELEKTLLASDLVSVFQRLSSSWGDQMQSVLQNAILAFLGSSRGGTLADLRRFLIEPSFRSDFLKTVRDPNVLYYWQKGFAHLTGGKSIGPVLTRLDMFLGKPPILHMVAQKENRLDFADIMDSGKIFLAKLPSGLLGKENSYLLGTLLISKFQQLAMSRQAREIDARRDFWLYVDEFHNFITPSMAEILSGARKYRIGLTLANHEMRQLQRDPEVASAVLSHPCTRICFRLGDEDARKMADGFSFFEAHDLQNLGVGEAIARIERSDFDFNLSIPTPEATDNVAAIERRKAVIAASTEKYGTLRSKVEAMLLESWVTEPPAAPAKKPPEPVAAPAPTSPPVTPEPKQKPARVPNVTDSEKKVPEPQSAVSEAQKPAPPVATEAPKTREQASSPASQATADSDDLGRGGSIHVSFQKRFRDEAWKLGFKAFVEERVSRGSNKAADLVIEAEDFRMAVEIPVEGSYNAEFGNVKKCLAAGFPRVAVVSLRPKLLKQLAEAVPAALGPEAAAKVSYYTPEEFLAELRKVAAEIASRPKAPPTPATEKIGNYEVETEYPELTPEDRRQREEARIRLIGEIMRQQKSPPHPSSSQKGRKKGL